MKIKLDENLTVSIVPVLTKLGHDVQTTIEEGLKGKLDQDIWQAAQREERFLMTQDMDFSDVRRFAPGTHQGILLLRLHSPIKQPSFPASLTCLKVKTPKRGSDASW